MSGLELVAQAPHRHHVARVGRVVLDLGPESPDVHVDETAVAEVAVAPHPLQQRLAAEHPAWARRQLDEEAELGLREVDLAPAARDQALLGRDLELAEAEAGGTGLGD